MLLEVMNNSLENVSSKAQQLCAEYIGGVWQDVNSDDLIVESLSGGFSNLVYKCYLPSHIKPYSTEPTVILLRLFLDVLKMGEFKLMTENIIIALLSELKIVAKVYGVFPEGRLEEFIPSRALKPDELHHPIYQKSLAHKLARIHTFSPPVRKNPDWAIESIDLWLQDLSVNPKYREGNERQEEINELLQLPLMDEIAWIKTLLETVNCEVVFCHCDFQVNNILVKENCTDGDDPLQLIDYEFSSFGYRGSDFASLYCSFCIDYVYPEPPYFKADWNQFPSVEEQKFIIAAYLEEYKKSTNKDVDIISEEQHLLEEPKVFVLIQHIILIIYALRRTDVVGASKLDWIAYVHMRYNAYLEHKKQFFGS